MRRILSPTGIALCLSVATAQAVTLPFEKDCEPFYSPAAEITWIATNRLPAKVRIFRVIAADYSPTTTSNLAKLGGSADAKRGVMNHYHSTGLAQSLTNVPDRARSYELGTDLLSKLGIPTSELAADGARLKAWHYPGTHTRMDKTTRTLVTRPRSMGIEFRRVLDGIPCFGQEANFRFESEEALTQLRVTWHGLRPEKECVVAAPAQIISWIREGRARVGSVQTTGMRWINVADIKKVKIIDARIQYDATPDWRTEKAPTYLYPYVVLAGEIELGESDAESFALCCPIIKEALPRISANRGEFGIFPSRLREQKRPPGGAKG